MSTLEPVSQDLQTQLQVALVIATSHGSSRKDMDLYIGTKTLWAKPMTRLEYNNLRQWGLPAGENPADKGYLVEYTDGGKPNHPDYEGYISWSPKDVFERSYRQAGLESDFSFGVATLLLERGRLVRRRSWPDKIVALAVSCQSTGRGTRTEEETRKVIASGKYNLAIIMQDPSGNQYITSADISAQAIFARDYMEVKQSDISDACGPSVMSGVR